MFKALNTPSEADKKPEYQIVENALAVGMLIVVIILAISVIL